MNGPSSQTWVDLMTKDQPPSVPKRTTKRIGVTVTPNTPRTGSKQYSRMTLGGPQGQVEILRSQVVSLLQEKQELTKQVQWERNQREQIERELKSKRINNKTVTFHDDSSSSSSQLQISALREALEQTTQERNTLRNLLTKEKDCSALLNSQLIEERTRNDHEKEILKEKDEQLEGMRTQIRQMRQELTTMNHLVKRKNDVSDPSLNNESLREQLTQTEQLLSQSQRERDALRERLTTIETHRQLSMEQYQEEVETSVLAVTSQLEELLELNCQLQEELAHSQTERDELSVTLIELKRHNEVLQKEKDTQLIQCEQKINQLEIQLQQNKQSFQRKIDSRDTQYDVNQLELIQQIETAKRELEKQAHLTETIQKDLSHQIELLKQENKSLLEQRESENGLREKLKVESKRLEENIRSLHTKLTDCQREKATIEAQLVTVKAELTTSQEYCTQLRKNINELRDVSQFQSQAENLSKQLTQTVQQLKDSESDRIVLEANVKKLESELQEMSSCYHKEVKSKQDQFETTQVSNQQLQTKVADLEKDIASHKKQSVDYMEQIDQLRSLTELRQDKIKELESTVERLTTALTDSNKFQEENHSLHSQIRNLKKSVMSLELERNNLDEKLKTTIEQNKATEEELKEENIKLHELLDNSLSLNEQLQSSSNGSSFQSQSIPLINKLSPIATLPSPCQGPLPMPSLTSPPPPPPLQFSSPSTEIVHLRQELTKARQTCLKLEKQQTNDMTEMAKVQGSLQALVKIQDHLSNENKSLSVTLEETKESYIQEIGRLNFELIACQDKLKTLELESDSVIDSVVAQTQELSTQLEKHSNNLQLTNIQQILGDGEERGRLEMIPKIIESLSTLLFECLLESERNGDNLKSIEEITLLQERVSKACDQLKVMEDELESKERELEMKDRQLIALQVEGTRHSNIDSFKKDLETQYQAKLAVVRSKLMEREDEVNQLQVSEQELKSQLDEAEVILMSNKEELETTKEELVRLRQVLTHCEASLTSETGYIEKEIEYQINSITAMKTELAQLKSQQSTNEELNDQRTQVRSRDESIFEIQSQVEMLRAKKTIFDKYVTTQETNEETTLSRHKDEIIQENVQLGIENDELKQELIGLNDTTQHMQDQIDILILRLEEVQEEFEQDKKLVRRELEESHEKEMKTELERLREELDGEREGFRQSRYLLESKVERENVRCNELDMERNGLKREIEAMKNEMERLCLRHQNELTVLNEKLQNRDVVCADVQTSLEHAIADRDALEVRLNESYPNFRNNNKKVEKLKDKLKQQIRQTNHIRMKLGYALSELRLYKQLKSQLDYQVTSLQQALTLSQQQYDQCLEKLNRVDTNHSTYHHET